MPPRIDDHQAPPGTAEVMWDLQEYVDTRGLEPALLELVKLRVARCPPIHVRQFILYRVRSQRA